MVSLAWVARGAAESYIAEKWPLPSGPKGEFGRNDSFSSAEVITIMRKLYARDPRPYRWAQLPEAFIGECRCYYPARLSEARALTAAGVTEETEYSLDHVPIFEPADGVTPSQVERAD